MECSNSNSILHHFDIYSQPRLQRSGTTYLPPSVTLSAWIFSRLFWRHTPCGAPSVWDPVRPKMLNMPKSVSGSGHLTLNYVGLPIIRHCSSRPGQAPAISTGPIYHHHHHHLLRRYAVQINYTTTMKVIKAELFHNTGRIHFVTERDNQHWSITVRTL